MPQAIVPIIHKLVRKLVRLGVLRKLVRLGELIAAGQSGADPKLFAMGWKGARAIPKTRIWDAPQAFIDAASAEVLLKQVTDLSEQEASQIETQMRGNLS